MPSRRHLLTACGDTRQRRATLALPPIRSMSFEESVVMGTYSNHSCHQIANHICACLCNDGYMIDRLCDRIRRVRMTAGDTLDQAGKKIWISRQAFAKWETGDTADMKLANLVHFCEAYRVDLLDLLICVSPSSATYRQAAAPPPLRAEESPPDERELIAGYRDATQEIRELMLDAARKATQKRLFSARRQSH